MELCAADIYLSPALAALLRDRVTAPLRALLRSRQYAAEPGDTTVPPLAAGLSAYDERGLLDDPCFWNLSQDCFRLYQHRSFKVDVTFSTFLRYDIGNLTLHFHVGAFEGPYSALLELSAGFLRRTATPGTSALQPDRSGWKAVLAQATASAAASAVAWSPEFADHAPERIANDRAPSFTFSLLFMILLPLSSDVRITTRPLDLA